MYQEQFKVNIIVTSYLRKLNNYAEVFVITYKLILK